MLTIEQNTHNVTIFLITEEVKETVLGFLQGIVRVLWIYFALIQYQYKLTQYNALNTKLIKKCT